MICKRVYLDENGELNLKPGEYGKHRDGLWYVMPKEDLLANLGKHNITEHEDGAITVNPSILVSNHLGSWHGYLTHGILKEC